MVHGQKRASGGAMHAMTTILAIPWPHAGLPDDPAATFQIVLRTLHVLAAILWVGLGYFFVLVNEPVQKTLDVPTRNRMIPLIVARGAELFRWASVATVLLGIWYWMMIVASDTRNTGTQGSTPIWTFFLIWTLAFAVEMGALMSPVEVVKKGPVLALIVVVVCGAAAFAYLAANSEQWDNHLLAIGIGGGLGWFMLFNVWGIVWRVQKKVIRWAGQHPEEPLPPELQKQARAASLAAKVNVWLSIPTVFFMCVAAHYPMFGGM
jgi:uncharacterized membrane protein